MPTDEIANDFITATHLVGVTAATGGNAGLVPIDDIRSARHVCDPAFGAIGDDPGDGTGTDDTAAIEAALTWAAANGRTVTGGDRIYRITEEISISAPVKGFRIDRLRLRMTGAERALHIADNGAVASTQLAADVRATAKEITVDSTAGMAAGQVLRIISDRLWPYDNRGTAVKGETNAIETVVSGTVLRLQAPLCSDYDQDTDTVTVNAYAPVHCDTNSLEIIYPTPQAVTAMRIGSARDTLHHDLCIQGATGSGISISQCFRTLIPFARIRDCAASEAGSGYGIQVNSSTLTAILTPNITNCRRPIDVSGSYPSRHTKVTGGICVGMLHETTGSAIGTHGPADWTTFDGVELIGGASSVMVRGSNTIIQNCIMRAPIVEFITWAGGPGLIVRNNRGGLESHAHQLTGNPNAGTTVFLNIQTIAGVTTDLFPAQTMPFIVEGNICTVRNGWMNTQTGVTLIRFARWKNNVCTILNNSGGGETHGINAVSALDLPYGLWGRDAVVVQSVVGTYQAFRGTITRSAPAYNVGVAPLTENGGAIGGTNDGNLPSLTVTTDLTGVDTGVDMTAAQAAAIVADLTAHAAALRELAARWNEAGS